MSEIRKTVKNPRRATLFLVWAGFGFSVAGGVGTASFLQKVRSGGQIPAGQVAARLVLPHVALLFGLGLILSAVILLRKQAVIAGRREED